ncbi:hypothetical protein [uncultured Fibrella sp.]|uniref:hypothetical protein n=1 Tax=uncultured Fibrella sp. TaxID=1284596 RepID=UPI0035CB9304
MFALIATIYQLYLLRVHNEKSLKPLGQIFFWDRAETISVQVQNNGIGPLIIDRLTFKKSDTIYSNIKDCVDLDPKSYMHPPLDDTVQRVILPNGSLIIFEATRENHEDEQAMNQVKTALSPITLIVDYRDIYDNKFTVERDFNWFSRHILDAGLPHSENCQVTDSLGLGANKFI